MSTPARRALPARLVPLALFLFLAGSAAAQDDRDLLTEVRQRRQVEAQRVEKEFAEGRLYAYTLVRKQPERLPEAVERLAALQSMIDRDQSLDAKRREVFRVTLEADQKRLAALARDTRTPGRTLEGLNREIRPDSRPSDTRRQSEERMQLQRSIGSVLDARRQALAEARGDRVRESERYLSTNRTLEEAAVPPRSEYDLPADWAEKSKRRSPLAKLTGEEKALLASLKKPISVEYNNEPLQNVIEHLQKLTGQTITLDKQGLGEANITYETPITLRLNRVSTRTVLKRIFNDLGLTYVIREGTLYVTTTARAKEMVTTRAYYIGDLAGVANVMYPSSVNTFQAIQAVNSIMSSIMNQFDPQSWHVNNPDAPGSITFDPNTMSLIIRQTAEIHYMLDSMRR